MATVQFEDGLDERLDGHFAGAALRRAVKIHLLNDRLETITAHPDEDEGTLWCNFFPAPDRRLTDFGGERVTVILGDGYVHLMDRFDGDGLIRSVMFRTDTVAVTEERIGDFYRRTTCPWSEDAFLRRLREALERWTPGFSWAGDVYATEDHAIAVSVRYEPGWWVIERTVHGESSVFGKMPALGYGEEEVKVFASGIAERLASRQPAHSAVREAAMKPDKDADERMAAARDMKVANARAHRERLAAKVRSGEWTVERFLVEGIGIPPEKVELYKPHVVI